MSQINNLSSAYSDDGAIDRSNTENLGAERQLAQQYMGLQENELSTSIRANISEHRRQNDNQEEEYADAIYEMPDEDENASSPPRSLSNNDIVSENI